MCGSGLRWTYVPTPQVGDTVKVRMCAVCDKRAKKPVVVRTFRDTTRPTCISREASPVRGFPQMKHREQCNTTRRSVSKHFIHTCCSRPENEVTRVGRVVRSQWSRYKTGAVAHFFLIVEVPDLGNRCHWATLETATVVTDPISLLGDLVRGECQDPTTSEREQSASDGAGVPTGNSTKPT